MNRWMLMLHPVNSTAFSKKQNGSVSLAPFESGRRIEIASNFRVFWKQYAALPAQIQKLARKNYSLWQNDQNHPSRAFKKLKGGNGSRFSIRIGDHYRAIAQLTGDAVEWVWIGSHEDY